MADSTSTSSSAVCGEPVAATVTDSAGTRLSACSGHAQAAREYLEGCTVTPLGAGDRV